MLTVSYNRQLRGLAFNFASTQQVGNSAGISKVDENKQLLTALVGNSFLFSFFYFFTNHFLFSKALTFPEKSLSYLS